MNILKIIMVALRIMGCSLCGGVIGQLWSRIGRLMEELVCNGLGTKSKSIKNTRQ